MKFTTKIIINRPVAEVWDFFDNSDNLGKWLDGFKKFEHVSGVRGQIGARARQYYHEGGREIILDELITQKEPYKQFIGILSHNSMESKVNNLFTDLGDGRTELQSEMETQFKGFFLKLMAPFIKGSIQKRQDSQYAKMKAVIESE